MNNINNTDNYTMLTNYSATYTITEQELEKLAYLLTYTKQNDTGYEQSILLLLKELDFNIQAFVRLLVADKQAPRQIFNTSILNRFTTLIKEAIFLVEVNNILAKNTFIPIYKLSNTSRYRALNMDRNFMHRTLKKYDIIYQKKF